MTVRPLPVRVVAVTQLPPPFMGQAVCGQSFVTGCYQDLEVVPVRMGFSRQTADIGRPRLSKVAHLAALIARVLWRRAQTRATVLYYPPAGPDAVPVIRDIVFLLSTRWAFRATVFHFHAAGVTDLEPRLRQPVKALFHAAYGRPQLAIQTSELNPEDGRRLGAHRVVVVPNGIADHPLAQLPRDIRRGAPLSILYVGVLRESKGVLVLIEACRRLQQRGVDCSLRLVGAFDSRGSESRLRASVARAGVAHRTEFAGVLSGDAKAAVFRSSDVFCYPTYFESESFGLAVVEAMQYSLPVVATHWRGVASVVEDGQSGLLVAPRDAEQLEASLRVLLTDPDLRRRMGERGRQIYLEHFTEGRFQNDMESVLRQL